MKLSLIVLATAFISFSASAAKYQNWMGSAARLGCVSSFEHQERTIVRTIKTNMEHQGTDLEAVKSLDIYSQVQIKNIEVRRKYVITSVMVDQLTQSEYSAGKGQRPTIVSGKHPITGEKIRVEIDNNINSNDSTELNPASLFIGGKEQTYLKLQCNVLFAG